MDLKLVLQRRWFCKHLEDKGEEYREITPYWANRLLTYDNEIKSSKWWFWYFHDRKMSYRLRIKRGIKIGLIKFREYDNAIFSNGMKPIEILPRFEKPVNSMKIGIGKAEWGAPEREVFIILCGAAKNIVNVNRT